MAIQTSFTVASESDLNNAIAAIDIGGADAAAHKAYSINFTAGFSLSTDIYAINLTAGDTLSINGAGQSVNGNGSYRGFFIYAGKVTLQNLTVTDTVASGGAGGAGALPGGGGAGLGGGLFVASGATAVLNGVNFTNDAAVGGNAGAVSGSGYGGGGGLGGAGGAGNGRAGGGGGVGSGAVGGSYGTPGNGGGGILLGAGPGGAGTGTYVNTGYSPGAGGANGGGGGMSGVFSGSGRDPRSFPGGAGAGGVSTNGFFGGGAGSGNAAGFGGGGATYNGAANGNPNPASGVGGWGGGGSGGAAGGFGGGGGGAAGGGLGAGGAIFVQQGGTLIYQSGSISGGTVAGGTGTSGGGGGAAYGSGIFTQGSSTLHFAPGAGQSLSIGNDIADAKTVAGVPGQTSLVMTGLGLLTLSATNQFSGGIALDAGTLSLQAPGAAGRGAISFGYGSSTALIIGAGDVPSNVIKWFLPGETIDLQGIGTASAATLGANDVLNVTGGTVKVGLHLFTGQNFTGESFIATPDGSGGTDITAVTTNNDMPPFISGNAVNGNDHAAFAPLQGVKISAVNPAELESATLTLSSTANGTLSNLGGGSYNAATGVYTVSGTAAAVTAAIEGLSFTPTEYQVAPGALVDTKFSLAVTDGTMSAASSFTVGVTALNDPPVITMPANNLLETYWNHPFAAFAGVSITDPDANAVETVTLGVSGQGSLALAAPVQGVSLVLNAAGQYTLTGSPGAVTAALDQVTFTPTTANPALGYTVNYLTVSVSDGIAPAVTAPWIEVLAGLPIVTGTAANQPVAAGATIDPFATVQITDSAPFNSETVTIILNNAANSPTDANGTLAGAGLTKVGVGSYTLATGTPGAVSAAIEALVFTPASLAAGQSVTTNFEISVFDGATTSDNYASSVIASGPGAALTFLAAPLAATATASAFAAPSLSPAFVQSLTHLPAGFNPGPAQSQDIAAPLTSAGLVQNDVPAFAVPVFALHHF